MAGEPLITVVGNLVADPEPRVSQAGKSWVTFRIASTPRVRDRQSGDWSDGEALWLGCRAYGEYADNIAASLTKGTRVIVQGRLTQRSYTDNQGQQRTSLDLEVEEIGPSLRFATTQVTRGQSRGQVGGFGGAGGAQPAGQSSWGQPAAPAAAPQDSPWANSGQGDAGGNFGGGFDDEQPF
ncbi:single-stranded DNA-binding protein [Leucobacter viscericola]|uniref:Single-stranded DNA-binding protein n=1 Tax=Leucobacter viscericola TaxID=2714935 RepID=A0A6G7XFR5_9MICO|nr:single-stranded DNA-binding protein [Leucobacter viscericola]QIK63393.1 single-stranded DNA-binding protein [Leucobacter viscericola]